jgi:TIR domain
MAPKKKVQAPQAKAPNVFIAWAGDRSKTVAAKLASWLPTLIDAVQPWMSEESLRSGSTWFSEIMRHLTSIEIGIVCLTPENLDARWIHFEAGALANKVSGNKRVIPYLIGLEPAEVTAPLSFFQHRKALEGPTFELVKDINEATGSTVGATILKKKFEAFWNELDETIKGATPKEQYAQEKPRPTDDMVREILELVRGISSDVPPWERAGWTSPFSTGAELMFETTQLPLITGGLIPPGVLQKPRLSLAENIRNAADAPKPPRDGKKT